MKSYNPVKVHAMAIHSIIGALNDLFFPPRCLTCAATLENSRPPLLCPRCQEKIEPISSPLCVCCGAPFATGRNHLCGVCLQGNYFFDLARSSYVYNRQLSPLIHSLKFNFTTKSASSLGALTKISGVYSQFSIPDIIVPVPLHITRLRKRGYNQALILARSCFSTWRDRIHVRAIQRHRLTPPQTGLSGKERKNKLRGCFSLRQPDLLAGKRILLVDDVFTTGTTVNECAKTIRQAHPAGIEVFTLARSILKNR
ncbi:MAG: amidophosphoribosyltransferase [Desulfobulbus propionicus]|nr:MAG: amidophosphoribosyltransferase [Desulfobulbus propionicus]